MCFWEYFNEVIRYQTIFIHDEILLGNKYRNGQTDSINNSFQNILQWAAYVRLDSSSPLVLSLSRVNQGVIVTIIDN